MDVIIQRGGGTATWGKVNNLFLNMDKTEEMVVDFRRTQRDHKLLDIHGSPLEFVKNTKFLGVHLAENITWSLNTGSTVKKAQQRLHVLRRLPPPTPYSHHFLQRDYREHPG